MLLVSSDKGIDEKGFLCCIKTTIETVLPLCFEDWGFPHSCAVALTL